ncbi:MAG: UDP-N-acetylglucosamine 2-epimerase [Gammaproteobacteria bacterium]|nr:UDP-N-acetylglucosamine 2-epimerase [Gammaproteobacteria bacterium]
MGDEWIIKAYYNTDNRSDKVLQDHLREVEYIDYRQANIVICTGDRVETHALAVRSFLDHKYIIHYYAGIRDKYLSTYDSYLRHCITILSDEQWVESRKCARGVKRLCRSINKTPNIKIVGSNHLLNVILDYTKVPEEPYNLVLYNPCTKTKEIFIGPNPDKQYGSLPQEQLLALVKECEKFYTNSSCGVYEAPFLIDKKKIIWLGKRNKGRKYK